MKYKFVILVASLLGTVPGLSFAAVYKYVDYSVPEDFQNGSAYFSIDTSTGRYDTGDSGDAVTFCGKEEPLYCLRTPSLSFGIPKGKLANGQSWEFDQAQFHVLRRVNLEVWGVSRQVWVIASSGQSKSNVFYYSEEYGLLGIKYISNRGHDVRLFMLSGRNGFPR